MISKFILTWHPMSLYEAEVQAASQGLQKPAFVKSSALKHSALEDVLSIDSTCALHCMDWSMCISVCTEGIWGCY
jgi:hypothetical protein